MGSADAGVIPEFFVSGIEHIEDMGDGNARFWYFTDRTDPNGVRERDTVCLVIMPISAIVAANTLRKKTLGENATLLHRANVSQGLTEVLSLH